MAFVYDAGSSTPGYDGLIEINGSSPVIRLNSASPPDTPSTATFRLSSNPLLGSAPIRSVLTSFPADDGSSLGPIFLDARSFTIPGWLSVPSGPEDVPAAQEMLKAAFAMANGPLELLVNTLGWSTPRLITAQTVGPITFGPHHNMLMIPTRSFDIPMVAPDPRAYGTSTSTVTLPMDNSAHAVANNGTADTPFTARFTGPWNTAASFIRNSDGLEITLTTNLAAGRYVDVNVAPGYVSATLDDGTDVYRYVTTHTLRTVRPGTENYRAAGSSGTTVASEVTVTVRDAWA